MPPEEVAEGRNQDVEHPTCQHSHWESQAMLVDKAVATFTFGTCDKDPFQIKVFWPSRMSADSRVSEGSSLSNFRLCRVLWISVAGTGKAHQRILLENQVAWLLGVETTLLQYFLPFQEGPRTQAQSVVKMPILSQNIYQKRERTAQIPCPSLHWGCGWIGRGKQPRLSSEWSTLEPC